MDKWRCVNQSTGAIASKQVLLLINRLGVRGRHRSESAAFMIIIDVLNNRYRSYRFNVWFV